MSSRNKAENYLRLAERFMREAEAHHKLMASLLLRDGMVKILRDYLEELNWPRRTADALHALAKEHRRRREEKGQ